MASTAEIQIQIQALQNQLEELNSRLIVAIRVNDTVLINQLQAQIDIDRRELTNLFNQVALPTASAGEAVNEAARARDDNAYSSNPVAAPTTLEVSTRITAAQVETGTDDPVRNLAQTQSVPPPGNGAPLVYRNEYGDQYTPLPGFVTTQGGAGALGDDSGTSNKNSTRAEIDNMFNQDRIVPQGNILDQYASYTYQFSLYLMSPEGYKALMTSGKKVISNSQLLIQSGGIPTANRNTYFPNDYYIENVQLKIQQSPAKAQMQHTM
jgi:hypothetical protein